MKVKAIVFGAIMFWLYGTLYAQSDRLQELTVGDYIKEFSFSNTHNFPSQIKDIKDMKGKYILLDFWGLGCTSCIASFPKMYELQKEFEGKLQIILVNSFSQDRTVMDYISKLKNEEAKKAYLSLLSSNGDKRWLQLFPHRSVPHHVWLSPEGKVLAITSNYNATKDNISKIINGEDPGFAIKNDLVDYDVRKNGLIKKGHELLPSVLTYSVFMPFHSGLGGGTYITKDTVTKVFRCTQRNMQIARLYKYASKQKRVFVQTKRIAGVNEFINNDQWRIENLFSYELVLPIGKEENYRQFMFEDLNRYFGISKGIEAVIQKRSFPAYVIIRRERSLKKNANTPHIKTRESVPITNFEGLRSFVEFLFEDLDKGKIVIDETNLCPDANLNFKLPSVIENIADLRAFLIPQGFDIVEELRTVEVLTIRDIL